MLNSILKHYGSEWHGDIKQGASGWNNTTYFIDGNNRSSVLRIYETHRDREKIEFEHAVLELLQHKALSFRTPLPVRTIAGETIVRLEDGSGRFACMFQYIDGMRPEMDVNRAAYSFGETAGELVIALAEIQPEVQTSYRPYYELQQSYPACSREVVLAFCENPPEVFHDLRDLLTVLGETYQEVCEQLGGLDKLPQQLVHGDLNYSNLLVYSDTSEQVVALLDFEFCTSDVRAMEPAVIISGLIGHGSEGDKEAVRQFCKGFGSQVRLIDDEVRAIPVLMRLRNVDVFLHFMSRFFNGTDGPEVLREQVKSIADELMQRERNRLWVEESLGDYLTGISKIDIRGQR